MGNYCLSGSECRPVVEGQYPGPYPICLRCLVGHRAIMWCPDIDHNIDADLME